MKASAFALLLSMTISSPYSFGQSNQSRIINKWLIVGTLKNGAVSPDGGKKKEYEFLNGNKINIYKDGAIDGSGTYAFASDQKSVALNIDGESLSLKIIKLTSTELRYVVNLRPLLKDTLVCYATNSSLAKEILKGKNNKGWEDVSLAWNKIAVENRRRCDLISNLIPMLKNNATFDQKLTDTIITARDKYLEINLQPEQLTAKTVLTYQTAMEKLKKAAWDAIYKAQKIQAINESKSFWDLQDQLMAMDNKVEIAIREYNNKVVNYNVGINDKSRKKDIDFKPLPQTEPVVNFKN